MLICVSHAAHPSLVTVNGTIQLVVPQGQSVEVVFEDSNGVRTAPMSLVMASDLAAVQSMLQNQINALQTAQATMSAQMADMVSVRNLSVIDSEVTKVVDNMLSAGPGGSLLAQQLSTKLTSATTCQCFDPLSLAAVDASLQGFQSQAAAYYVDRRHLTVIDGEVSSVVAQSMTPVTSSLASSVSALQSSSTFFVDSRNLSVIIGTVASVAADVTETVAGPQISSVETSVSATAAALDALRSQAAAFYVDRRDLGVIDGEIVSVVDGMVGGSPAENRLLAALTDKLNITQTQTLIAQGVQCWHSPGILVHGNASVCIGTPNAASCAPQCELGYTVNGTYDCVANTWFGHATCVPNPCSPSLTAPANGAVSSTTGVTGSSSSYSCSAGFTLTGPNTVTCLPSGSWSNSSAPMCVPNGQTAAGALPSCTSPMVTATGLYFIQIALSGGGTSTFQTICRVDPDGTKWLMFQRRTDTTDFYLGWSAYAAGFGGPPNMDNFTGNSFWLGLETLYQITRTGAWKLRVDLLDQLSGQQVYEEYATFAISSSATNYVLTAASYTGTAGDALTPHSGYPFSTYDADHDTCSCNCAIQYHGAWWYTACHNSNLNGILYTSGCYVDYADGTDWCGGAYATSFPGDLTVCNTYGDGQPCHHNSLKSWMLLAPSP